MLSSFLDKASKALKTGMHAVGAILCLYKHGDFGCIEDLKNEYYEDPHL